MDIQQPKLDFQKVLQFTRLLRLSIVGGLIYFSLAPVNSARAQITPDATLSNEESVITPNQIIKGIPSDRIDGGAIRGANLFHSFTQFNITEGRAAYFTNPTGIENILARVTGNKVSNILGTLGILGTANLFLINSNGIVFGQNAQLDIGGSFVATTADAIGFGNNGFFSASNPEVLSSLLTVNPSALLFNQIAPAPIQSNSTALAGLDPLSQAGFFSDFKGLRVQDSNSLLLVGGNISINGGGRDTRAGLLASGGRVELGGLAGIGTIGLNMDAKTLNLSFPDGVAKADVSLTNYANVSAIATNGGSIAINARNLDVEGFSFLRTGILPERSITNSNAGNIEINAQESVRIDNFAVISNAIFPRARGQAGDIRINAGSLSLSNGGQINVNTIGRGNAGNVMINVEQTILMDSSIIVGTVEFGGIGKGGEINISTGSLFVNNGSRLATSSNGLGDAGNITIKARDLVSFDGRFTAIDSPNIIEDNIFDFINPASGYPSTATTILAYGIGTAGNLLISTGTLSITNGAELASSTLYLGNAGNITIEAKDRVIISASQSGIFAQTDFSGNAGNITLKTPELTLQENAQISTITTDTGKAGDITLNTDTLNVVSGGKILAFTNGSGNGGTITVIAPIAVNLGIGVEDFAPVLSVETSGAGKAGDIFVTTPVLTLSDTARITATATNTATNTENAGSISLNASTMNLAGIVGVFAETQGKSPAGTLRLQSDNNKPTLDLKLAPGANISASTSGSGNGGDLLLSAPQAINISGEGKLAVETTGTGNAGNIQINTQKFTLSDGVQISASTSSSGIAGNITLEVSENITLTGSGTGIFANTTEGSTGKSGSIIIDPSIMRIADGAKIAVDSQGESIGGDIELFAGFLSLDNGTISAATRSNTGGNISLRLQELLLLRNGSQITTTAGNQEFGGNGGNITINTPFIVAVPRENSDITANAFTGNGGRIAIATNGIFGILPQDSTSIFSDITASSELGVNGVVQINEPEVDPARGLVELPTNLIDASQQLDNTCSPGSQYSRSSFTITGRGGLPLNPREVLTSQTVDVDWVSLPLDANHPTAYRVSPQTNHSVKLPENKLVEAQKMVVDNNGNIVLVAQASTTNPLTAKFSSTACTPN
jgi:filamentous hemagglutinin family protein